MEWIYCRLSLAADKRASHLPVTSSLLTGSYLFTLTSLILSKHRAHSCQQFCRYLVMNWSIGHVDTSSGNHECLVENIWMRCFTSLAQRRSQRITTVNQHIPLGIVNVFTEVPDSQCDSFPPDRLAAPMSPSGSVSWWTGYKLCSLSSSSACLDGFQKSLRSASSQPLTNHNNELEIDQMAADGGVES